MIFKREKLIVLFVLLSASLLIYHSCSYKDNREKNERVSPSLEDFESMFPVPTLLNELEARKIDGQFKNMRWMNIYFYDFDSVQRAEKRLTDLSRAELLKMVFQKVTKSIPKGAYQDKWYAVIEYLTLAIRHPPVTQPMNKHRRMVSDPMVLLLLGEGRCGHIARVVVDMAIANGYEARLVQLACHYAAEIKWDNRWHFIDANADFPIAQLKKTFSELPSIYELSKEPYLLDRIAARGWKWDVNDYRTLGGQIISYASLYPGTLLLSSIYFGDKVLANKFSGDPSKPREGIIYYYKHGNIEKWENDKYYGWKKLYSEVQKITPVPLEYDVERMTVLVPHILYSNNGKVTLPIRFLPAYRPTCLDTNVFDCDVNKNNFSYEVRLSRKSRGWDYGYRNYRFMPGYSKGDLGIFFEVKFFENGTIGLDVELKTTGDVFVEVIPRHAALEVRHSFAWPSCEAYCKVFPEHYEPQ